MARLPIMPVFTDALVGDTLHLSAEQFGAYVLILMATWRNNGQALPDDDKRLAQIARVTPHRWRNRLRPTLVEFFEISDGFWHQKRLENEFKNALEKTATQRSRRIGKGQTRLPFGPSRVEPEANRSATSVLVEPGIDHPKEASLLIQDSPSSCSDSESGLACAREGEPVIEAAREVQKEEVHPLERADARLVDPPERCGSFRPIGAATQVRIPSRAAKSPALKAKIKDQLRQKHDRFLKACRPGAVAKYWTALLEGSADEARRMFDEVDHDMRASRWDDMAWWKRRHGLHVRPGTRSDSAPRAGPPAPMTDPGRAAMLATWGR